MCFLATTFRNNPAHPPPPPCNFWPVPKVMKTLQYFVDKDDIDFDEAAESAVKKRKVF